MKRGKRALSKKSSKLLKGIESSFSKRAEDFVFNEIKKEIAHNPALMNQLQQAEKNLTKGASIDIE